MHRAILLFWPSFIIAAAATGLFFSIFDPQELTLHGAHLFNDKLSAYSVFFLIAWGFGVFNTSIVLLLEKSPRQLNNPQSPAANLDTDSGNRPHPHS